MYLFQILESCTPEMETLVGVINFVLNVIRWAVPLVLLVLGSIDLFKAMASGDEKKTQEARKTIVRRLIYGVSIFLLTWLITLVFSIVGRAFGNQGDDLEKAARNDFFSCWNGFGSSDNNSAENQTKTGGKSNYCTCKEDDGTTTPNVKRDACTDPTLWNGKCID